jgi:hypothetical protein
LLLGDDGSIFIGMFPAALQDGLALLLLRINPVNRGNLARQKYSNEHKPGASHI